MTKQRTCEERIGEHLESRLESIREMWELYHEDSEAYTEDGDNFIEFGLAFDYVARGTFDDQEEGYFRYQLSYGGPSDEFQFFVNLDYKPYRIEYWFMDWFDGASRRLYGADRDLLEEIYEWFNEVGATETEFEKAQEM